LAKADRHLGEGQNFDLDVVDAEPASLENLSHLEVETEPGPLLAITLPLRSLMP